MIATIDGPAGAGKSTVAKRVAEIFGFLYLDTGAMYRAVTLKVLRSGVDPADEKAVTEICRNTEVSFDTKDSVQRVLLDGETVTEEIRSAQVTNNVSKISSYIGVRERMWELQREFGRKGSVVAEGRDAGTHIFPNAEIKIYLTASEEERAHRRWRELLERDPSPSIEEVKSDLKARDDYDSNRFNAPLRIPKNAILIDTTEMNTEETVESVRNAIKERL